MDTANHLYLQELFMLAMGAKKIAYVRTRIYERCLEPVEKNSNY